MGREASSFFESFLYQGCRRKVLVSMKVCGLWRLEGQLVCCYFPVKKALARLQKSTMPTYRTLLTTMELRSSSCWTWTKHTWEESELPLSAGTVSGMLPARLALCDLEAPGWGEPRWLRDWCMAFSWFVVRSCFILSTNPRGDTMLSSLLMRFKWLWTDQLITDRAVFGLCPVLFLVWLCGFCLLVLCFLFGLCWSLVLARWQLNGLCIDPTQFYFWCTLSILWCCHCINSRNLNTGFPASRAIRRWTEKIKQCHILFVARVGLRCWFCDFAVSFCDSAGRFALRCFACFLFGLDLSWLVEPRCFICLQFFVYPLVLLLGPSLRAKSAATEEKQISRLRGRNSTQTSVVCGRGDTQPTRPVQGREGVSRISSWGSDHWSSPVFLSSQPNLVTKNTTRGDKRQKGEGEEGK